MVNCLFFQVSFLWVFPRAYWAVNIPFPNAILIHGEPVGFPTPPHREKRSEKDNATITCSEKDYKPRRRNYCCNKCLAGDRVERDCAGEGQRTQCIACESGTYTDIPNNSKRCESCSSCLAQYGQIVLSECTSKQNTQCGCPEGQYKHYSGIDFTCQECITCSNGTEARKCHDDKDTVCKCFFNFFFDDFEKRCRPCSECQEPDCKNHCPKLEPSTKRIEDNVVVWVLIGVIVAVVFAAGSFCMVQIFQKRKHSSSHEVQDSNEQTAVFIESQDSNMKKVLNIPLPGYTQEENIYVTQPTTQKSTDASLPLPDITKNTTPPCLSNPEVVYTIIESIPVARWREFVRRLGLSNHTIDTSERDNRYYSDAQYAMMQVWISREGNTTTKRDQLFNVLEEINLGGCIERIKEHL
ncbi:tumor necrosis factor receptor superfamily member 1A-like [Pyxicephalus adspersus]|uniref:Tumor necrosis factor receptor superfamily member 1A n=1 Tax=Pyxicephalus adspersus TaxID=30357 RepID=A0AAV2ZM89_PYXAD|nr:TPA: hypothetical protein GDO54_004160 [Pyxicephalus adspersus]